MPTSSSSFTSCNPGWFVETCSSSSPDQPNTQVQLHVLQSCSSTCAWYSVPLLIFLRLSCVGFTIGGASRGCHGLRHDERGSLVIFIREAVEIACSTPCAHVGRVFRLWEPGAIPMVAGEMLKKGLPDWFRITFGYWAFPFADPAVDSGLARRHRAGRWHYILQPRHFFLC